MNLKQKFNHKIIHFFLTFMVIISLIPFLWMVGTSFKSQWEIFEAGITPFPRWPTLENYLLVLERSPLLTYYANTFIVAASVAIVLVAISMLAAYGFTRFNFWGPMMAAATLTTLPPLIMYFFTQRFIIESYIKSGIKG
jgi:multiple sugar transport system permease protein